MNDGRPAAERDDYSVRGLPSPAGAAGAARRPPHFAARAAPRRRPCRSVGLLVGALERQLHAHLTPPMVAVGPLARAGGGGGGAVATAAPAGAGGGAAMPVVARKDFALQQMLHVKSGVEFLSARTSGERHAPVAACFTADSAAA